MGFRLQNKQKHGRVEFYVMVYLSAKTHKSITTIIACHAIVMT
jgi:hypothetical protein